MRDLESVLGNTENNEDGRIRVYIDFDDVICETAKHFCCIAKELFDIDLPYQEVLFLNLKKSCALADDQYEELMNAGHLPQTLLAN